MRTDEIAVNVKNISKTYKLLSKSDATFFRLVKRFMSFLTFKFLRNQQIVSGKANEFHALSNISFQIRKGESWGFIGVNGSGKSTLLKIISGNIKPSAGQVEVDGRVSILDYSSGLNGEFTGRENIFHKATIMGLTQKQIMERYDSIVAFAEIGDFIDQPVKTYSSGMCARLGFAIMAHMDADIIITDEALAVGDVFFVQKCMKYIRSFLNKGTFLFVSHSVNDIVSLCQYAVWLEHGVIKQIGPAAKVTQAYMDYANFDTTEAILPIENNESYQTDSSASPCIYDVSVLQPEIAKLQDYIFSGSKVDYRWDYLSRSCFRNDIAVIIPEERVISGVGGANILNVMLYNEDGLPLSWCIGGDNVRLIIEVMAEQYLSYPIVGFQVFDGFGQVIFSENSSLVTRNQAYPVKKNTVFFAEFLYRMPVLPLGKYYIRVAVAIGETDGNASMLQAVSGALILNSMTTYIYNGLVGLPMNSVNIKCEKSVSSLDVVAT